MKETLKDFDFIAVYIMLVHNESCLDIRLQRLKNRMERQLYDYFSIDEFQQLEQLYVQNKLKLQ